MVACLHLFPTFVLMQNRFSVLHHTGHALRELYLLRVALLRSCRGHARHDAWFLSRRKNAHGARLSALRDGDVSLATRQIPAKDAMMDDLRFPAAVLSLSVASLIGLAIHEGFTDKAVHPVKGDVPTYGFGSTRKADGTPVKMGDTIAPPAALQLLARDVAIQEGALKACLDGVSLTQGEYEAYVSLAYNVGSVAICKSSIPAKLKVGEYAAACRAILSFNQVQGRNCCLPENKSFCGGVCKRRQAEYQTCVGGGEAATSSPLSERECPEGAGVCPGGNHAG
jgi:lysozyme